MTDVRLLPTLILHKEVNWPKNGIEKWKKVIWLPHGMGTKSTKSVGELLTLFTASIFPNLGYKVEDVISASRICMEGSYRGRCEDSH